MTCRHVSCDYRQRSQCVFSPLNGSTHKPRLYFLFWNYRNSSTHEYCPALLYGWSKHFSSPIQCNPSGFVPPCSHTRMTNSLTFCTRHEGIALCPHEDRDLQPRFYPFWHTSDRDMHTIMSSEWSLTYTPNTGTPRSKWHETIVYSAVACRSRKRAKLLCATVPSFA